MHPRSAKPGYRPGNPKVDIFDAATGQYLASTRWYRTAREAVAAAERLRGGRPVRGRIDHDARRPNPARPKRTRAACARAGKNLTKRRSTRAGKALRACAPKRRRAKAPRR